MPVVPKELRSRSKRLNVHKTNPSGHAGSMSPGYGSDEKSRNNKDYDADMHVEEDNSMDKSDGNVEKGSFLKHPQVRSEAIKQHKLINDTAYFLHHPQIKPHGAKMPPKKPKC